MIVVRGLPVFPAGGGAVSGGGGGEAAPARNRRFSAQFIRKAFSFFALGLIVGYIVLVLVFTKIYELWAAVAVIAFFSPYFYLMLKSIPILRETYLEEYAAP